MLVPLQKLSARKLAQHMLIISLLHVRYTAWCKRWCDMPGCNNCVYL